MLTVGDPLRMWAEVLFAASDRDRDRGRDQESELRHDLFLVLGHYLIDEVVVPQ